MPYDAQDDGFHEIQLSGKQLVFLFMATTVVSVVIFLCGVLVGRGVPRQAGARVEATGEAAAETDVASAAAADASVPTPAETQPTSEPNLSYPERLSQTPPAEKLGPRDAAPAPDKGAAATKTQAPPPPAAATPPTAANPPAPPEAARTVTTPPAPVATTEPAKPAGGKWTVQVAALKQRSEAETIARRLQTKGYLAYVVSPGGAGGVQMFRVRVGSYTDRAEAERVMRRLAQEEQFRPWITR
jgi:DedD protein